MELSHDTGHTTIWNVPDAADDVVGPGGQAGSGQADMLVPFDKMAFTAAACGEGNQGRQRGQLPQFIKPDVAVV